MFDNSYKKRALDLLCAGFKQEFAEYVFESEEFVDAVQTLSARFVDANIPIVNEDDRLDLAFLLMESIKLGNY